MLIDLMIQIIRGLRRIIDKIDFPGGLRLWTTLLCLFFLAYSIFQNSESISSIALSKLSLIWLICAVFITWLSLIINALAWKIFISWLQYEPLGVDLVSLFLSSNILKYLPGGIWHFIERIRVLKIHLGTRKSVEIVLLEPFLMVSAALLLVLLGGWQRGFALFCILPAICFVEPLRGPLLNQLARLKAGKLVEASSTKEIGDISDYELTRGGYPYKALITEICFVIFRFFGFWLCLKAFGIELSIPLFNWIAAFSLAWTIGLVIPAAPGGLGVFEACLLIKLGASVPEAPLIASLLFYRVVSTLSDLLAAIGAFYKKNFIKFI